MDHNGKIEKNENIKKFILDLTESPEKLLNHYFSISNNTATVRLVFDSFAELIDQNFGDDSVERLNPTLFDKMADVFALIPRNYLINVDVYIKDFGDYSIKEAQNIVQDNIKLLIYSFKLEQRRKQRTGLLLLGGGIILLLLSYFMSKLIVPQLFFDVINISGTLLVWESANTMLIERGANAKHIKQYIKKFKNIRILQA